MEMFCNQCEEANKGVGCTLVGVCGKDAETAGLQDLLLWLLQGLSQVAVSARAAGVRDADTDLFVAKATFSLITNVNFDPASLRDYCNEAIARRDSLAALRDSVLADAGGELPELSGPATWGAGVLSMDALLAQAPRVGQHKGDLPEDVVSLRELLVYGLKGLAAYTEHAAALEHRGEDLLAFLQEGLSASLELTDAGELVALILRCGEMGVQAMALLDEANTGTYGHPEPTTVDLGVRDRPGILVSGHDLRDLSELLEQSAGQGIDIYTHGEMLPAQAYPAFKKYEHFAGNYGGAWFTQRDEFEAFNGPILMTSNCVVKPKESYKHRLFTTSMVAWPGAPHVADRPAGGVKDFGPLIEMAKECEPPKSHEDGQLTVGFARNAVAGVLDPVLDAVKSGAIKRFVVMAGCDGRHKERAYYTELAQQLPQDHVILTAGCAKYRYNKLDLGDIDGIPRVLDAGQCNDSYSLVATAQAVAGALGVEDLNDLPISYDIAWYEQKAVIVLLALLHLGVKNIRLGPKLPAFVSPGVLDVLVKNFGIQPIGTVEDDLAGITAGAW